MTTRQDQIAELAVQLKTDFLAKDFARPVPTPTDAQFLQWAARRFHIADMAAIKDTAGIPVGYYCYGTRPDGTKGRCPYWSGDGNGQVWKAHCAFLDVDSEFDASGPNPPQSLIWDQVKECDQNPEPPPSPARLSAWQALTDIVHQYMDENARADNIRLSFTSRAGGRPEAIVTAIQYALMRDGQIAFGHDPDEPDWRIHLAARINEDHEMVDALDPEDSWSFSSKRLDALYEHIRTARNPRRRET